MKGGKKVCYFFLLPQLYGLLCAPEHKFRLFITFSILIHQGSLWLDSLMGVVKLFG